MPIAIDEMAHGGTPLPFRKAFCEIAPSMAAMRESRALLFQAPPAAMA
jgi:hypothetical protein